MRNEGTIVNNETVALTGNAAQSANAQTIKSLGLTGTGAVVVGELDEYYIVTTVDATYTNNGVKLLVSTPI